MKAKDLIRALQNLDPEADVKINIKQFNKAYGVVQLPIDYGSEVMGERDWLNSWVNMQYQGSITVHLPQGAYIAGLPKL